MSRSSWWYRIDRQQPSTFAARSCPKRRARPVVESLETRVVPTTVTVQNLNDAGAGSLRDAITQVNNSADPTNRIAFAAGLHGTITLETALPDLAHNVSVDGPGASYLIVARDTAVTTPAFGIFTVDPGVAASLTGLTICTGNAPDGAGINNQGSLVLRDSVVTLNTATDKGGGIFSNPGTSGSGGLVVVNSLIDGNKTGGDGGAAGIDVETGSLTLTNSTVEGNQSTGGGNAGGLALNGGSAVIVSSTIAGNVSTGLVRAGGLDVADAASATLANTLIAANSSPNANADVRGTLADLLRPGGPTGHNLIGNGSGASGVANGVNGDQVGSAARPLAAGLAPLQDNGGATPTMALTAGSPAIDAGSTPPTSGSQALAADQRGFTRVMGAAIDIGAYEFNATLVVTDTTLAAAGGSSVQPGQPLSLTATVTTAVTGAAPAVNGLPGPVVGTVHFSVDGQTPTDVTLTGGTATLNLPSGLTPGPHIITVAYDGNSTFAGSMAAPFTADVPRFGSVTTLTASATSPGVGQPVTFTATVRSAGGGMVTFLDGSTPLGSVGVNPADGTAALTLVLGPGPHQVTAVYSGDPTYAGSSSAPVAVTGAPALTGDVTSRVQIVAAPAPKGSNGKGGAFTESFTIINRSGAFLGGPLSVVLRGLRRGVKVRGADGFVGTRKKRSPFVTVEGTAGTLLGPNGRVTVTLHFSGRPGAATMSVFVGSPPRT